MGSATFRSDLERANLGKQESGNAQTPSDEGDQYLARVVLIPFLEEFVNLFRLRGLSIMLGSVIGDFEDLVGDRHHFWAVNQ